MTSALDDFVEEARSVTLKEAVDRLPLAHLRTAGHELVGLCPVCGSTSKRPDGLSVHPEKAKWNCRKGSIGGTDGIGLAAHVLGLRPKDRRDFLLSCAAVLGRPAPDAEPETMAEREEREQRLARQKRVSEDKAAADARASLAYRDAERRKAFGKWSNGKGGARGGFLARAYIAARFDIDPDRLPDLPFLRGIELESYWHGVDERGRPIAIHEGPAMVAPFVLPSGEIVGCHLTWTDLSAPPRFRPMLKDAAGEALKTKKMRGTKKGGLIPLIGFRAAGQLIVPDVSRRRLAWGEGIENVLAVAIAEGPRRDTIYAAAGDLGNLAGPADPKSAFSHPTLKQETVRGPRAIRVSGPVPRDGQSAEDACQAPEHVTDILWIADGDSEPFATAAAMKRAMNRLSRPGRDQSMIWPPPGRDFTDLLTLPRRT